MSEMFGPRAPQPPAPTIRRLPRSLALSERELAVGRGGACGLSRRLRRQLRGAQRRGSVVRALEQAHGASAKMRVLQSRGSLSVSKPAATDSGLPAPCNSAGSNSTSCTPPASPRSGAASALETDRPDVALLRTTLMGWLRGEPGRCAISSSRAPQRQTSASPRSPPGNAGSTPRLKVENQIAKPGPSP